MVTRPGGATGLVVRHLTSRITVGPNASSARLIEWAFASSVGPGGRLICSTNSTMNLRTARLRFAEVIHLGASAASDGASPRSQGGAADVSPLTHWRVCRPTWFGVP